MQKGLKLFLVHFIFFLPIMTFAAPFYGAKVAYSIISKEPPYARGIQFMLIYDPNIYHWRKFNVYFDGGFSNFWITNTPYYTTVNIYSIAPVIRYTFDKQGPIHPYIELSIGIAYLNHTRLDNRNLGIHFSFQDRAGIGLFFGETKQLNIGIHALHYSNARLSSHNSGISMPMMLDVGYKFC